MFCRFHGMTVSEPHVVFIQGSYVEPETANLVYMQNAVGVVYDRNIYIYIYTVGHDQEIYSVNCSTNHNFVYQSLRLIKCPTSFHSNILVGK